MASQETSPRSGIEKSKPVRVSIRNVADRSGVSIATVSRVLNSPDLVSPGTAETVLQAVHELGYRPNLFAKSLLSKRSRVIGVSLPDIHGEFYAELMHSADRRACELGYHLLVSSKAHHQDETPASGFALDLVDGLIVMLTERSRVDLDAIGRLDIPVAVVGVDRPGVAVETITCDNTTGAVRATEHLLESTPPERCFFVGTHRGNLDSDERAESFVQTLRSRGHEPVEDQLAYGEFSIEWGWYWAMKRIQLGLMEGSAILAANDEIAIGIANLQQTLAPNYYILHGDVVLGGPPLIEAIAGHVRNLVPSRPGGDIEIVAGDATDRAALLGAAGLVLSDLLQFPI